MNELPYPLGPGDKVTGTWINQLLRAIRRMKPLEGPGVSTRVTPDGTVLSAAVTAPRATPHVLAPFTVRLHKTEDDQTGQWEIYLPPGCCNVGGTCEPMNTKANEKSGHEDDDASWYAVPGLADLIGETITIGTGNEARQATRKWGTVYVHVKPSAKVDGVDQLDAPARRLYVVCIIDEKIVELYAQRARFDLLRRYLAMNTLGDIFSTTVAEVTIIEDGDTASETIKQRRTTPIDLVPPAGTGVSGFDLVWVLELTRFGQLRVTKLLCVRQTAAAAGITITGDTMTDVVNAQTVYARIDATDMNNGSGIVQVLKDPEDVNISSPYVVWLPLYDLKDNNVTADHRAQSLVNLQLFHA